jgi:Trypsin-like peptidase domain
MYAPPPRQLLYLAYKLEVEFTDSIGTFKTVVGTAFLLSAGDRPILVTNRHVVDLDYNAADARYKDFRLTKLVLHGRLADDSRYSVQLDPSQAFLFHATRENDVACLIDFHAMKLPHNEFKLHHHNVIEGLATAEEFETTIWPGDQVYFSGYPTVHDKLDQRPILRGGIIASDPKYNYSTNGKYEGERVAYEVMSTSGASGSPVYAPARGIGGLHEYVRRDIILGINAGHIEAELGAHSGMSYFIKSTVIREILRAAGVEGA